MRISVVAVGRVKDPGIRAACEEYAGRIRRHYKLDLIDVPDGGSGSRTSADGREREARSISKAIPDGNRVVGITRRGKSISSAGLAGELDRWQYEARDVSLIIGGASGFAAELESTFSSTMSLSDMTLPHEIARLVLLEQLYRAGTILRGEPYHKGPAE